MRELGRLAAVAAAQFARDLWVYLVLAALLTTIMATSADIDEMAQLSSWFVGNLLLSLSIAASIALGFVLTLRASYVKTWPRPVRFGLTSVLFVVCVLSGVELGLLAIQTFAPSMGPLFTRPSVWIVALPVSLVMMGIGFVRDEAQAARARQDRVERLLAETRLEALSARTDPHFLFNSLNSIAALVEEDPKAAERAILELSAMFRYVLDGSRAPMVKLDDELGFVRSYLSLEHLRFGERLHVRIEIEDGLGALSIPPLLLQPLVENAVRHGVGSPHGPVQILLSARRAPTRVELSVDDDGPGPGRSKHAGSGTSHADLRARLALLYGADAVFETSTSPLGGFRALIGLSKVKA